MGNETKTVQLAREALRNLNYYDDEDVIIEEQRSENPNISKLLKKASKSETEQRGMPEFIIWKNKEDILIIIECKASVKFHESDGHDKPKTYAVDGVLHYARFLKERYNIVALAISGETEEELKTTVFFWHKNEYSYQRMPYCKIDLFDKYCKSFNPTKKITPTQMRAYAHKIHNKIRSRAKLKEAEKPLFVGGVLMALSEPHFKEEYRNISDSKRLARRIIQAIEDRLKESNIQEDKRNAVVDQFNFIKNSIPLLKQLKKNPSGNTQNNSPLHEFLFDLDANVGDIAFNIENQDIMGEFYNEFIRYTGGDGKGLGIVLTPFHITELFADLADIHKNSRVIDICMGTSGFLVTSMMKMLTEELTIPEILQIKNNNLYGIESQADIFALACVNMFIRGDGKANLRKIDCFDPDVFEWIKDAKCDVALINPPYSQKEKNESELDFILRALNLLNNNGKCVVIVPLSCTFGNDDKRMRILDKHTLEAVMIMPTGLFPKENTHTCIMVFTAHKQHTTKTKTWFSVWGDDGYTKFKNIRIDRYHKWKGIKKQWLDDFDHKVRKRNVPFKTR